MNNEMRELNNAELNRIFGGMGIQVGSPEIGIIGGSPFMGIGGGGPRIGDPFLGPIAGGAPVKVPVPGKP